MIDKRNNAVVRFDLPDRRNFLVVLDGLFRIRLEIGTGLSSFNERLQGQLVKGGWVSGLVSIFEMPMTG